MQSVQPIFSFFGFWGEGERENKFSYKFLISKIWRNFPKYQKISRLYIRETKKKKKLHQNLGSPLFPWLPFPRNGPLHLSPPLHIVCEGHRYPLVFNVLEIENHLIHNHQRKEKKFEFVVILTKQIVRIFRYIFSLYQKNKIPCCIQRSKLNNIYHLHASPP